MNLSQSQSAIPDQAAYIDQLAHRHYLAGYAGNPLPPGRHESERLEHLIARALGTSHRVNERSYLMRLHEIGPVVATILSGEGDEPEACGGVMNAAAARAEIEDIAADKPRTHEVATRLVADLPTVRCMGPVARLRWWASAAADLARALWADLDAPAAAAPAAPGDGAAAIVLALAQCPDPVMEHDRGVCPLCQSVTSGRLGHETQCPWLRSQRWWEAHDVGPDAESPLYVDDGPGPERGSGGRRREGPRARGRRRGPHRAPRREPRRGAPGAAHRCGPGGPGGGRRGVRQIDPV